MMIDTIKEFVARRDDATSASCSSTTTTSAPIDLVRAMCSDELGVQLLFIPEEYGGMGGDTIDVYRVCEEMARIDLGVATSVLRHLPRQRPDLRRRHGRAEERVADRDRRARDPVRVRRDRARGGQRPRRAEDHGDARDDRTAWSPATGSTAASSGSATAASPTCTPSSPRRRAGRPGSCSSAAPRASPRTSPRTSTASGCPTPPRCTSTTRSCRPATWSAASRGRA